MMAKQGAGDRPAGLLYWCWAVVWSGLAACVFDAVYFFGKAYLSDQSLLRPLHNIAAFWLGNASFAGGGETAALGLATHFGLSIAMAVVYAIVALNILFIRNRPAIFGAVYGAGLYVFMYYVVMAWRWPALFPRFNGWDSVMAIIVHIVFGLIIALVLRGFDKASRTGAIK